jgi:hypothetical protein
MNNQAPEQPVSAPRHEIYIPGHAAAKLGMTILGILLIVLSMDKLAPLARLGFSGGRALAEAIRIVRTDATGQEKIYTHDAQVLAAVKEIEDARDRSVVFWVEYKFPAEGRQAEARAPIGQHVKPLYPLRDRDGLPSTISIWYDKANPGYIAFPYQFGTWFMPGMILLFGILCTLMGLFLWWHAKEPIEMPDLRRSHAELDKRHPKPH